MNQDECLDELYSQILQPVFLLQVLPISIQILFRFYE